MVKVHHTGDFPRHMRHDIRFPTMLYVRPAKAQTFLRIRADRLEPLMSHK